MCSHPLTIIIIKNGKGKKENLCICSYRDHWRCIWLTFSSLSPTSHITNTYLCRWILRILFYWCELLFRIFAILKKKFEKKFAEQQNYKLIQLQFQSNLSYYNFYIYCWYSNDSVFRLFLQAKLFHTVRFKCG